MRLLIGAIIALVIVSPAIAGIEKLSEVAWWAAYGGTREDGAFVCAMVTVTPENQDRKFIIEHVVGTKALTIRLLKSTWTIPAGTSTEFTVKFGYVKAVPLVAMGEGAEMKSLFPLAQASSFLSGFRSTASLEIDFQRGNEPPWSLSTGGEGFVEPDFIKCIKMNAPQATHPPTQPY
ncbi:MAG TPA: hypothetical protein VJ728_06230 [Candidatus Binataceae bacterium]|nr:hypothetical protein [Candidatus Binataceae bacterium]